MSDFKSEFEGVIISVFGFFVGGVVAYISLCLAALFFSGALFTGATTDVQGHLAAQTLFSVIFLFIPLVAPFLAAGVWGAEHGAVGEIVTPAGPVGLEGVPLFGVFDGALSIGPPAVLLLIGLVLAFASDQSSLMRPVMATAVGVVGYVAAAGLFIFGSALLFNIAVDALVGALGGSGGTVTITYRDPVGALVDIGIYAVPFVGLGAVLGTGWIEIAGGDTDVSSTEMSDEEKWPVSETRGTGSGPRPGDELPDLETAPTGESSEPDEQEN